MSEPMPREIIVLGPGQHRLDLVLEKYPWVRVVRYVLKGGEADGGGDGYGIFELYDADREGCDESWRP